MLRLIGLFLLVISMLSGVMMTHSDQHVTTLTEVIEEETMDEMDVEPLEGDAGQAAHKYTGSVAEEPMNVVPTEAMTAMVDSQTALYAAPMPGDQEAYPALQDPGFASPITSPLSTFAADVDTAAYANVRRLILDQQTIAPDAVRIEEMINAFPYEARTPSPGEALAVTSEVAACPWNEAHALLRIHLNTEAIAREGLPPVNLVFLIDTSGSMDTPEKLPLVRRSFELLARQLTARDTVSIVTYAGSSQLVLDGARGDNVQAMLDALDGLNAWGSTAGADGIQTAYDVAERNAREGAISRVILATDGDFNVGPSSEAELLRLIEEKKQGGVFLTVLGFGYGNLKDTTLQTLAEHGDGQAAYIDTIHEARRALVDELGATLITVAKDVKLQVEFNPETVEGYRLIGYESRRMADADFADDTKDGGEMGAGHSVTALYELIPTGAGEMPAKGLTYQRPEMSGSDDYATLHIRYKQPDAESSDAWVYPIASKDFTDTPSDDFTLAAAIAAFGQLLAGSDYTGDIDTQRITDMLRPLLADDETGRIAELSTLVRRSEGLYARTDE